MTKRDYLRSLGFNVGERGRFTDAMKHAIESYGGTFDEPASTPTPKPGINFQKLGEDAVRLGRTLKGRTVEGYEVGFVTCRSCAMHMIYCTCKEGILAPSIVVSSKEPDVRLV
jgi:hypothetical protein